MNHNYSATNILKNIIFNFLGSAIPFLFAIVFFPILLTKLGTDKFGVLNLAWIIIGYFGFFDLGIGRALTKIISEKIGLNQISAIPPIFWTSFFLMLMFSSVVSLFLFSLSDNLVFSFFKIPVEIQSESIQAFYLLIFAIPLVTTTAGIRGVLEAYQRFDIVNVIRIILGSLTFFIPIIVLIYTRNLFWIIFFLIILRIIIWFFYLISVFKLNPALISNVKFDYNLIKPIFKLSGWMTISNIIVPIIIYIDRIVVASIISASALTYYATPYEIISKILIIPSAITAVLFPTFAANFIKEPKGTSRLSDKVIKYIILILFPIIITIIIFAFEFLQIWLGDEFAFNSYKILQFLSIGFFFNSIAFIPFSFIEGIGRPDVTAKLQLIELPFYIFFMLIAVKSFGTLGASFVFMLRMITDCILMIYFSKKIVGKNFNTHLSKKNFSIFMVLVILIIISLNSVLSIKIVSTILLLLIFLILTWTYFLDEKDKIFIILRLRELVEKLKFF